MDKQAIRYLLIALIMVGTAAIAARFEHVKSKSPTVLHATCEADQDLTGVPRNCDEWVKEQRDFW
jgi:hypothetical protein